MSRIDHNTADLLLSDEEFLSEDEQDRRIKFGRQIIDCVPLEALEKLQIIQPAIGCVNQCNFCSQVAGPVTREMDVPSLRSLFGSLKYAMSKFEINQIGHDRMHKPGVIFPYLDNDIGSYPHLKEYLIGVRSIGGKTRISTAGWSRKNPELQAMHEGINSGYIDDIDGIRFSLTPYTIGWRADREEYVKDFGNSLKTYKPLLETKGSGRRTACVELRFAPDVRIGEVFEKEIGDYKLIQSGEYSFIIKHENVDELENGQTEIKTVSADGVELTNEGVEGLCVIGSVDALSNQQIQSMFANPLAYEGYQYEQNASNLYKRGNLHCFRNTDGKYFVFNPTKDPNSGVFDAIHIYPKSKFRQKSGVLDATRPFLNALMKLKAQHDVGVRDDFPDGKNVTYRDVLSLVRAEVDTFSDVSARRAEYIEKNILPILAALVDALRYAEIDPNEILNYGFVVDTGVIVNQGKAISEFKGLASRQDLPLTPNEEKGYGVTSQSSVRGNTWRIAPVVTGSSLAVGGGYGRKSLPIVEQEKEQSLSLGVFEWNPQTFDNHSVGGTALRSILMDASEITNPLKVTNPSAASVHNLRPGS